MKRDVIVILPILLVLRDRARFAHCFLATGHRQELSVGGGKLQRPRHSRHHQAGIIRLFLMAPPAATASEMAVILSLFGTSVMRTKSKSPKQYHAPTSFPPTASHAGG
jgi:hypothetical protein